MLWPATDRNETTGETGPSEFRASNTGHALIIMSICFAADMTHLLAGRTFFDDVDIMSS